MPKALIVGAGIGGLAAAVALKREGWTVHVLERASLPRELGFALLLAPKAMHALGEIGLADAVRRGRVITTSSWYLSLHAAHFPIPRDAAAIANRCAMGFHEPFRAIVRATPPEDLRLDELVERDPIAPWGRGPATLLGDAAHPMLPHAGQGAAQALENAVVLGSTLRRAADIEPAMRHYERARIPRRRAVVTLARRNARMGSIENAAGCWIRDQVIRFVPQAVILKSLVALGKPPR